MCCRCPTSVCALGSLRFKRIVLGSQREREASERMNDGALCALWKTWRTVYDTMVGTCRRTDSISPGFRIAETGMSFSGRDVQAMQPGP